MFSSGKRRKIRPTRAFAVTAGAALAMTAALAGSAASASNAPQVRVQDTATAMAEPCQEGWLCIWGDTAGNGKRVDFYTCNLEDVREYGLQRVGSYVNNQIDGTVATFKGPDASNPEGPWTDQYTSTAFDIRENTGEALTYGVQVC